MLSGLISCTLAAAATVEVSFETKMKGQVMKDTAVEVPANAVWDVYRGLELARLVDELLPDVIGRVEVVEGDGSVGTIVKVTFPPGNSYYFIRS